MSNAPFETFFRELGQRIATRWGRHRYDPEALPTIATEALTEARPGPTPAPPLQADWHPLPGTLRHTFTHFRLTISPLQCRVSAPMACNEPGMVWLPLTRINDAALPTPIRKILSSLPG